MEERFHARYRYFILYPAIILGFRWPDYWHADNWHGGQLALTFLIVSYLIILMIQQITNFTFK